MSFFFFMLLRHGFLKFLRKAIYHVIVEFVNQFPYFPLLLHLLPSVWPTSPPLRHFGFFFSPFFLHCNKLFMNDFLTAVKFSLKFFFFFSMIGCRCPVWNFGHFLTCRFKWVFKEVKRRRRSRTWRIFTLTIKRKKKGKNYFGRSVIHSIINLDLIGRWN